MANISNSTANTLITGTNEADSIIVNTGTNVTINALYGDDTVRNAADFSVVNGDDGNDRIDNYAQYVTVNAGNGNDVISNQGNLSVINGGAGNDKLSSINVRATLNGGDGDDTLEGSAGLSFEAVIFNPGSGNNYILAPCAFGTPTINTFGGNDTIKVSNNKYGALIFGSNLNDTITIMNGIMYQDGIITISAGKGDDVIIGGTSTEPDIYLYAEGDGNDTIYNYDNEDKISITSKSYYNTLVSGNDVIINVGDGSMLLKNAKSVSLNIVTIEGGKVITNYNNDSVVSATAYDDTIENHNSNRVTINAGAGNDSIYNNGYSSLMAINAGTGNDSIYNYASKVTINADEGNDFIENGGSQVTINSGVDSDYIYNYASKVTINAATSNDIVSLYGSSNDNIIQYAKGDGKDTIYGYNSTDTIEIANDTYSTQASGNDVIINVGDGSMLLKDAKGETLNIVTVKGSDDLEYVKLTNASVSPYVAGSNVGTIDGSEVTKKAFKITGNDHDNVIIGGSKSDTFIGGSGDDTFVSSAGKDIVTDYEVGDTVSLTGDISKVAANGKNVTLTSSKGTMILSGANGKKVTFVDSKGNVTKQTFGVKELIVEDGDGSSINTAFDSTVITLDGSTRTEDIILIGNAKANTLIGGSGNDELTGGKGKDLFIYNGGDDLITDYTAGQDIIKLDGVSIKSAAYTGELESDLVLTTDKGTLTIENAVNIKSSKGKAVRTPQLIKIIDDNNITTSQSYQLGTINTLAGAAAADTISGFSTNDLLIGGKGKDVFIYGSGHDTISDYVVNQDSIILNNGNANDYSINGSDVVIPIDDDNSLTIQNAKAKKVKINNVDITFDDQVNVTLDNKSTSPYTATDKAMTIDASKRTKAIKITANDNDNTITGGKGNDTLTGGAGKDVFKYTVNTGNDVITDYSASEGDLIRLGKKAEVTAATFKDNDLILTVGKNKVTVQGGATQAVTVVNDSGVKMTYEKWSESIGFEERFFVDDNFATNDLDEIISSESNLISGDLDLNKNTFDQSNQIVQANYKKKK